MRARGTLNQPVIAFSGREYVNYEWREIPISFINQALENEYLILECEYCGCGNSLVFYCKGCGAKLGEKMSMDEHDRKIQCHSCGRLNHTTASRCDYCGSPLII